ncbi:N-6 DNA methylase [Phycicoccus sp. Soil803]|uniref:N-6 DNA methylase n=1 Tax=Phycicoccus sp. Soil803 TaxID=1736415 RepID=UPI0007106FDB|nr:N-6 DNA methylase [Phycicoccus sp. Soil803]KRF23174.1 methyltransferase [Phycicoccus sp. Soil803]
MLHGDTAELRKARGAYFTPRPIAAFVTSWAVRHPTDAVLEPSCGEAVFLHQVGPNHTGPVVGVELHTASAAEAESTLRAQGVNAEVHVGDFFLHEDFGAYDAAIGNPPYVRYQGWTGEARTKSRAAALRAGVNLTNLASSWAAFAIHSALHLRRGGRLGLVLPAELLTVNYAAPVRRFLMDHFSEVNLVLFEQRVFPGVDVEAVLLLADGYDPDGAAGTDHMAVLQVRDADGLTNLAAARRWTPLSKSAKWTAGMLSTEGLAAYSSATSSSLFEPLATWGDTTLGMVSGNNKFFALSPARVRELRLTPEDVVPISPPGSRHLRQLTLTQNALDGLGESGQASWLFRPAGDPSAAAKRYIQAGEALDVHEAYKCRVRSPWWRVPYLRPADLFLTYMNADTPRLATNRAKAHHLNSVHGVYLRAEVRTLGKDLLPLASLNSVTLLGAETVGRAYGGGMLKIEPREADLLPLPSPALVGRMAPILRELRPTVRRHLAKGQLHDAVRMIDSVLLAHGLGMSQQDLSAVRSDHALLTGRRAARGRATDV